MKPKESKERLMKKYGLLLIAIVLLISPHVEAGFDDFLKDVLVETWYHFNKKVHGNLDEYKIIHRWLASSSKNYIIPIYTLSNGQQTISAVYEHQIRPFPQ